MRYRAIVFSFLVPHLSCVRFTIAIALWAALFVGILGGALWSPTAAAQSYPEDCKPNPGGTLDCTSKVPGPYSFLGGCQAYGYYRSESAAFAAYMSLAYPNLGSCPVTQFDNQGWLPWTPRRHSGSFKFACPPGLGSYFPTVVNGFETANYQLHTVVYATNPPACTDPRPPLDVASVKRERHIYCTRGWTAFGTVCYRNTLDPVKNAGPPCPRCGNPINPGTGNKYEKETDYVGPGIYPLTFVRHYNSARRIKDRDQTHFSEINFFDQFGNSAYAYLAIEQPESPFWGNRAIDSIGANWTHTYLRSLQIVTSSNATATTAATQALTTAFAYRPDGRVLSFNLYDTQWVGDADVVDRVVTTASGYEYSVAETGEVETYDTNGKLLSIRNRGGISHTLAYDSAGRLLSVTDSWGHSLTFTYDAAPGDTEAKNRIWKVADSAGGSYEYAYDLHNNLVSVTAADGQVRQYLYEAAGAGFTRALTGVIDESNNRYATWGYDSQGRASASEHAGAVDHITLTHGSLNTTATDANGVVRTYAFSNVLGVARVTSITQPAASGSGTKQQTFAYDVNGNVTRRRDFNGNLTCYSYDLTRNLETSRTEGLSGTTCPGTSIAGVTRTVTTTWHPAHRLPDVITESNRTTDFDYDTAGNLLKKTVTNTVTGSTRVWEWSYDSSGRVLTEDGLRTDLSDVTTYTYYTCSAGYQCGQLQTITNALGHTDTYSTYNAHGQPLTITDPNGVATTLAYDARQRLISRQVGGEITTLSYWPTGLLKRITQPDGSFLEYSYDDAHRLISIADGDGNRIDYTLDAMGNRTAEQAYDSSNALARTRTQVFNNLNRLWKQLGAAGTAAVTTTFSYDDNGNQTVVAAPLGRSTTNQYDALNRLKQATDPGTGVTLFAYDVYDNLTSVTDPRGKTTSYTYNALGDMLQLVSPETGTSVSTYDSGGNLQTSTDARGEVGTRVYDALNRVTSVSYPDLMTTFTYDAGVNGVGRLTGASDANHSLAFTYDAQGRVTNKSQVVGGVTKSVTYGYTDGNLTSIVTPSGQTIAYTYANGRIGSIALNGSTVILDNVLYEPFGPVSGWTWGNATIAARIHDQDGKPTDIDSAGAYTYTYDDAFRITGITDLADGSNSWTYGYDNLDRLNAASRTGLTQGFTYDANGNRLSQTGTIAAIYTVSTTSNRVTSISGTPARTYTYDLAGNVTSDGTHGFAYNDSGRLSSVSGGAGGSYVHNALGQRVKKVSGAATLYFVYDEAGHLVGEYDGSGGLVQETVWLGDIPVATLRPNGSGTVDVYYVHTDHLNTPRRVSRPSDDVIVWRWDGDAFGASAANEDPDGDATSFAFNLRFPGQYFDAESGLHYNYFRNYDPVTGRYLESDPIGLAGGINTYGYVGGNPLSYVDPLGLQSRGHTAPSPSLFPPGPFDGSWNASRDNAALQLGEAVAKAVDALRAICDPECRRLEAEIAAKAKELRLRLIAAQIDHRDLYNKARVSPLSRRGGSWAGHKQQFEEKQKSLRDLIAQADANRCIVNPEDRALSTAPYPARPEWP